jgi:mRNA-degrading endonuclease toxin of MazEF toxin-antitoxin module
VSPVRAEDAVVEVSVMRSTVIRRRRRAGASNRVHHPRPPALDRPATHAESASFRPEIEVAGETTRVLVEQLGAVDAQRLGGRVELLSPAEMWAIDDALLTVLGLA